uniref:Uncharacterized protein n=1 Tax=viral metagenome TaxID=1070528 RepID=A0A6C0BP86_9ZZZZ
MIQRGLCHPMLSGRCGNVCYSPHLYRYHIGPMTLRSNNLPNLSEVTLSDLSILRCIQSMRSMRTIILSSFHLQDLFP